MRYQRPLKKLTAAAAMLMLAASIASAQLPDKTDPSAQDYRIWSAEQMIQRIAEKMVRTRKACDQAEWTIGQRLSEKCIASVVSSYPVLGTIRQVARSGDAVQWAKLIDAVHQFEAEIEGPLNTMERR